MKAYKKDIFREIIYSKSRFISILLIAFIATITYVGLNSSIYDMKKTVGDILNDNNMYDIRIDAPYGFSDYDSNILSNLKDVESIHFYNEKFDNITKTLYIDNDKISNEKEAYILVNTSDKKINFDYNITKEDFDISYIQNKIQKYGVNVERAYFVKPTEKIKNVAVIKLKNDKKLEIFDKNYLKYVNEYKENIKTLLSNSPNIRKNEIITNIDDGLHEIENNVNLIDKNSIILNKNENEIKEKEQSFKNEKSNFYNAESTFKKTEKEINDKYQKLLEEKNKLLSNLEVINRELNKINANYSNIVDGLNKIKKEENDLLEKEKKLNDNVNFLSKEKFEEYSKQIKNAKNLINVEKEKLLSAIDGKKTLEDNKSKIESGLETIIKYEKEILEGKNKLNTEKNNYYKDYKKNLEEIKKAEKKINDGKETINSRKKEINDNLKLLSDKKNELDKKKQFITKPVYEVGTIFDNTAFKNFDVNIQSTEIMAIIFPVFFVFIALFILVSTMIRFINEKKQIIGIYKFLGYKDSVILSKFLTYSLLSSNLGILLGSIVGIYIFPRLIYPLFLNELINIFDNIKIMFIYKYVIYSFIIINLSLIFIIFIITQKILDDSIVNLILKKDKATVGKIYIERFYFWKKLTFSKKILFRNLLKYKSRLIMTIIGISSCTALIYLGLSLNYSIKNITKEQYEHIQKYDNIIFFRTDIENDKKLEYINKISKYGKTYKTNIEEVKINKNNLDYNISLVYLLDDHNVFEFLNINPKYNEVYISRKTADILGNNKKITLKNIHNEDINLKIDGIFENYIHQYVYVKNNSKEINSIFFKYNKNTTSIDLFDKDIVYNIMSKEDTKEIFEKQIDSIFMVVIFMIFLGATLSVVVTYNLGNLNILERKREISTLEVLGYSHKKRSMYIFREILILSLISIIIGMFLGRLAQLFVAKQFVNSPIQLVTRINFLPIIISFSLSLFFVLLVVAILIKKIDNIDMIESLKVGE